MLAATASAREPASAVFVLELPRHSHRPPVVLPVGKYIIGSAEDCQVVLPAAEGILLHHALLIVGERKTHLRAWDDRTWINDWPVKESVVRPGDRISFGPVTCRFRAAKADEVLAEILPPAVPDSVESKSENTRILGGTPLKLDDGQGSVRRGSPDPAACAMPVEDSGTCRPSEILQNDPAQQVTALEERLTHLLSRERGVQEADENSIRREREADRREQSLRDWEQRLQQRADKLAGDLLELDDRQHQLSEQAGELARQTETLEAKTVQFDEELKSREAHWESIRQQYDTDVAAQTHDCELRLRHIAGREAELTVRETALTQSDSLRSQWQREQAEWTSARQALEQRLDAEFKALQIEADQLQEDHAAAEAERTELAQLRLSLEEQSGHLDENARQFASREETLNERDAALTELSAELDAAWLELDRQRSELQTERETWRVDQASFAAATPAQDADVSAIEELNGELLAGQTQLAADREALAAESEAWRRSADERQSQLTKLEAEADAERTRLTERAATLAAVRAQLKTEYERLDDWRQTLQEQQERLESEQAELSSQRTDIEAAESRLSEEQQQAQTASHQEEEKLAESERRLSRLHSETEWLHAEREKLEKLQTEWDAERVQWQETLEAESQTLTEERTQLSAWETKLEEQEAELVRREEELQEQLSVAAQTPIAEHAAAASPGDAEALQNEIERLAQELNSAQELRGTLESQITGIRQRHDHAASQWQSERVEWVLQRERLERDLAEATKKLSRLESRPAPSREITDIGPEDTDDVADDQPAMPMDDRPDYLSEDTEPTSTSDRFVWQAREPEFAEEDDAATDSPVSNLRSELARMFDLPADREPVAHDAELEERVTPAESEIEESPSEEDEPSAAADDWRSRLGELLAEPSPEPVEQREPPVTTRIAEESRSEPEKSVAKTDEDDSIASYMERLLARNRRQGDDEPEPAPVKGRAVREEPAMPRAGSPAAVGTTIPIQVAPEQSPAPERRRERKPQAAPDKETAREHLQKFRQVANASARTAVAKHTSKTMRVALIFKGVITVCCAIAAGFFLHGWLMEEAAYFPQAMASVIMSALIGADLLRNLLAAKKASKRIGLTKSQPAPATPKPVPAAPPVK